MRATILAVTAAALTAATAAAVEVPVSLRGSPASMERQHAVAVRNDLSFAATPAEMRKMARRGDLVALRGDANYGLIEGADEMLARPETRLFIERLSSQYREACGEKLIVTSATRPKSTQPSNSHRLSVHPTGAAVDLRVSKSQKCRDWLEWALLGMEGSGLLDITREFRPPHYHVALFPSAYAAYAERRMETERAAALAAAPPAEAPRPPAPARPGPAEVGATAALVPAPVRAVAGPAAAVRIPEDSPVRRFALAAIPLALIGGLVLVRRTADRREDDGG